MTSNCYICVLMFLLSQCSAFTIKYTMERVEGVESRVDTLSKLRRSDLAEIFGQLASINNKFNTLNTTKDALKRDEKIPKVSESGISKIMDYIVKGVAAEKLERARTTKKLFSMVNSLAANNSKGIEMLDTLVDKLGSEMKFLVSTELLNEELKKEREVMTSEIENLESELATRKKMEEQMKSKINLLSVENRLLNESITSEIVRLKEGMETKKERDQTLLTKIDALIKSINHTASSCQDVLYLNQRDGIYQLSNNMKVYCDQTTNGGGWTVFQRRKDGSVNFERKWADYKTGFGDLDGEFWLGNDNIHALTSTGNHELRIDMEDFEGNKAFAKYNTFKVKSEKEGYALEVSGYSGNAGDSLKYHNNRKFFTTDQDIRNCARSYRGAWWYNNCHESNLNGFYFNGDNSPHSKGINWKHWKGFIYSLKFVEMKLR